jgi:hypothetical protein
MKLFLIVLTSIAFTANIYGQSDSTKNNVRPPDINNTNDGMNQNRKNDGNMKNQDGNPVQNPNMNNEELRKNADSIPQSKNSNTSKVEGYIMQDGKMMYIKNGINLPIENQITLSNGTIIMSDGSYISKGKGKMTLRNGQRLDTSGNLIPQQ